MTRFFEFVQLKSLKEDDFNDNLIYLRTELLNNFRIASLDRAKDEKVNKSTENNQTYYERTYEFRSIDKESTIYLLNLYELGHKHYELKRLVLNKKMNNQNELIKEKLIKSTGFLKCHATYLILLLLQFLISLLSMIYNFNL